LKTYAADRLNNLQESVIRSITRYAFEKGAILLAQGFPDFDPPQEVLAAAEKAMRNGRNQYGMTWGQPSLRAAIAEKSRRFYGQEIDPDKHVTVTCGVTEAVIAALLGYCESRRESRRSGAGPRKLSCGHRVRRRDSALGSAASTSLSL
jgi:aminotransferase